MYRQRRDSDLNMCNWISQAPQKSRHRSRSRRDHGKIDVKQIVATTVSSRIVGIRRRMEGTTTCCQDQTRHTMNKKTKLWREKVGANRVSHTFTVTFQCSCIIKTKMLNWNRRRFERTRGEGGGRQRYRHVWRWRTNLYAKQRRRNMKRAQKKTKRAAAEQNEKVAAKRRKRCRKWNQRRKQQQHWSKQDNKWDTTWKIHHLHRATKECGVAELKWTNWRIDSGSGRIQDGRFFNQSDVESKQCWDLGDTARTHIFHGSWKIREQTRSWNSGEQEVAKTYQLDRLQLRTGHMNVDHSPTTLKRYTDQSRNSRNPKRTTYKLWETSMRIWDQGLVLNVSVLDRTHSKEGNKRGDWMKQWPMIQNFTAPNKMYRKNASKAS